MTSLFPTPRFALGVVVSTPGALEACSQSYLARCIARHQAADWGQVCQEDKATNHDALQYGGRILSAYPIDPTRPCKGWGDNTVWIITEADRSVTTCLLPREY